MVSVQKINVYFSLQPNHLVLQIQTHFQDIYELAKCV